MLSGVVFDMDGVLIDSHSAHKLAWRGFLAEIGKEVSDTDLEFVLDGRRRDDILRHFLGELSEEQILEFGKLKDGQFFRRADLVTLKEGLLDFLDDLERHSIAKAVATSATSFRAMEMLKRFEIKGRFSAAVTGNDVEKGKPDPAIFRLAGTRLNLPSSALLVVEDAVSGVKAAKAAGMQCLGMADESRAQLLLDAGADAVVPDFSGVTVEYLHQLVNFDS
jgi:HAD superfamily hydrolase (TIGR01509 family)